MKVIQMSQNQNVEKDIDDPLVSQKRKILHDIFCDSHIVSSASDCPHGCDLLSSGGWEVQGRGVSMGALDESPLPGLLLPLFCCVLTGWKGHEVTSYRSRAGI